MIEIVALAGGETDDSLLLQSEEQLVVEDTLSLLYLHFPGMRQEVSFAAPSSMGELPGKIH